MRNKLLKMMLKKAKMSTMIMRVMQKVTMMRRSTALKKKTEKQVTTINMKKRMRHQVRRSLSG